jgi:hypothetical protein
LESTTGKPIHVFEVEVLSDGMNVAKSASQSSTLKRFEASRAIDGKPFSFSHTSDANAWLEIDLEGLYPINSVEIANRWCKDASDPRGCLCRLSDAKVSLIDENGNEVASQSIGDACQKANISIEIEPISCSPPPTPAPQTSGDCDTFANKVRIESTTGQQIQVFEVEVYPHLSWDNVAQGKSASQSSTLKNRNKFAASRAVDGNFNTFSHTSDQSAWWQVDLEDTYDVDLVWITNRYCGGWNDPKGCLCRLSYATVSLLDASGSVVSSQSLGDTCDEHDVFIEFGCNSTSYMPTYMPTSMF